MFKILYSKKDRYVINNANSLSKYIQENCLKQTIDVLTGSPNGLNTIHKLTRGKGGFNEIQTINIMISAVYAFRCTEEILYLRNASFGDKAINELLLQLISREKENFEKSHFETEICDLLTMHNAIQVRRLDSTGAVENQFNTYMTYIMNIFKLNISEKETNKIIDTALNAMVSFPPIVRVLEKEGVL